MTRTEQGQFVRDLIANVKTDILYQLPLIPDTWDGHELRQYIADRFSDATILDQDRKRYRTYKNTILTMGRR